MATALLAYAVSRFLCPQPIYAALAERFRQGAEAEEAGQVP